MKTKFVREINSMHVLEIIREQQLISRADIVKRSKLAFPTVMRIVDNFIQQGLLIETEKDGVEVGRKPMLLSLRRDAFYIVSVVIHATIDVLLLDFQNNILAQWSEPVFSNREDCMQQLERVVTLVNLVISNTNIERSAIAGVGVSRPGTDFKVDPQEVVSTQFSGWNQNIDVRRILEEKLGLTVLEENISRTLAYGEMYYGWGREFKDFLFLMVDYGLSGSLVHDGKVLCGQNNVAGEYGHMSIDPINGRRCYCGNRGCIESYISEVGLVKTMQERMQPGGNLARHLKNGVSSLDFQELLKGLGRKDEEVEQLFRDAGRLLGYHLVSMINMVNPGVIVLGGSVVLATPIVAEEARRVVYENVFSNKARNVKILTTRIEADQQYLGSTALVITSALKNYISGFVN